jgi:DNA-binding NarL/FixJ family response regulator
MIRVLLADDQTLVRSGLRSLIEHEPDLVVVAEAANGDEAIHLTIEHRPDIVLMDVRMPGTDGLAATERITSDPELASVKVVVLTTYELDDYIFRALSAGASGFLLKTVEPADLRRAIRLVADGRALLDPAITKRVIAQFAGSSGTAAVASATRLDVLTEREREVMRLVADGLSNDEIGRHLFISTHTAKTHVNRAMTKLNVRDRAQLVVLAYRAGLIS